MKISDIEFDGIDYNDYPDFCDAYIVRCLINGEEATEEQIEELNSDSQFVYDNLINNIF